MVAIALIGGAMVACSRDQAQTAGLLGCGACLLVSQAGATVVQDELGGCDATACDGQCNPFYAPVQCMPSPGPEGQRCGVRFGQEYGCAAGLRCAAGPDGVEVCTR